MLYITKLQSNQVFVFGSNLEGIHGAGAARLAREKFGARPGVGEGITGACYAIPTKITPNKTMDLDQIRFGVKKFLAYAEHHPWLQFLVTPVGTGLAGYTLKDIQFMFSGAPGNVVKLWEF